MNDKLENSARSLSPAVEDYLKAIYEIQQEQGSKRVSTSALADKMGVTRASVTGMLKKLAATEPLLVEYVPYHGVELTEAGEKIALEVVRHHRLIESYLTEALGYSWDEVHQEADQLEHVISNELEERIDRYLGHPELDPHGHPIPDKEGGFKSKDELALSQAEIGLPLRISAVSDHDPEMLRYLEKLGLVLEAKVELVEKSPFEGPLHIRVLESGEVHALSRRVTDQVYVTPRGANS